MTNIFVGNLSYQTTQEDLHAALEQWKEHEYNLIVPRTSSDGGLATS